MMNKALFVFARNSVSFSAEWFLFTPESWIVKRWSVPGPQHSVTNEALQSVINAGTVVSVISLRLPVLLFMSANICSHSNTLILICGCVCVCAQNILNSVCVGLRVSVSYVMYYIKASRC